MSRIKVIAFDGDDTLWVNEPYYQETERQFCELMNEYATPEQVSSALLKTEIQNMSLYGYGAKGFTLSMVETAIKVSKDKVSAKTINVILELGKELIDKPVELLGDVKNILTELKTRYTVVIATKGDLLDQQRKLKKSGLETHFHHIEIMSDKTEADYQLLFKKLDISPADFMMVGNSLKSDILPVIGLGGTAIYIPYHVTWQHETETVPAGHPNLIQVKKISDIWGVLGN
ncbi:MAG: HAD family hydrolase [Bacteroidetes bacterium GWF2_43_63]|nr:MAG: HAD family hydrolase [Bacteroidetes bacterium GWE2_42_42]OFY53848.1 MAG: HAD family hydrolase [Bacteroidetes bacterium GWF2_43_63]HBG69806.1 HAD family hydrolase [Bacteroidales bacterium]HCB60996.1 HAD family hydrolase [Bacteroidales bacterium]HCY24552.1 HAD family hydrolase [Bacteroidales bacterium]